MSEQSAFDASTVTSSKPGLFAGVDVETRPYQMRIVRNALAMFAGAYRNRFGHTEPAAQSVMIESPTGSGKTVMGLEVARQLQRRHGYSIGWVAMRRNLLAQVAAENAARGFAVDMHRISMFDRNPPVVDVLVVDEAQHDAVMSMANLHCTVQPKKVLGLTATPFRTDRIKLCFDKIIKDAGIHQLIQDGYLSRYHHYTIPEYTPQRVAEFYLREPDRWGKTLIFFHRLIECEQCLALLRQGGTRAEIVTAQTDRQRQIADFTAGKIDVLLNMMILTEGFDCPTLKTVFCRPSGRACTIQMGGRVFRKHPALPFKQIVQCSRTRHPFIKTAMAEEQYVWTDGQWRTLTLNRHIAEVSDRVRRVVASRDVTLPSVVAHNRSSRPQWRRFRTP